MAAEAKSTKGDLAQGTTADPGDPGDPGAVTQTARAAKYSWLRHLSCRCQSSNRIQRVGLAAGCWCLRNWQLHAMLARCCGSQSEWWTFVGRTSWSITNWINWINSPQSIRIRYILLVVPGLQIVRHCRVARPQAHGSVVLKELCGRRFQSHTNSNQTYPPDSTGGYAFAFYSTVLDQALHGVFPHDVCSFLAGQRRLYVIFTLQVCNKHQ